MIEGASEADIINDAFWASMTIEAHFEHYVALGYAKMDAIKAVTKDRGVPKNEIYKVINQ